MSIDSNYTRVKWNKSHRDFGYFADAIGMVPNDRLTELSKQGYVQVLPGDDADDNTLPDDMPARDLLFADGFTLDKLQNVKHETLIQVKGIGNTTATEILAYLAQA